METIVILFWLSSGFLFPRSGHRVVVDDSNLYVLGGYNPKFLDVPNTDDTYYPLFKEVYMYTVIKLRSLPQQYKWDENLQI